MLLEQVSVSQAILTVGGVLTFILTFINVKDKIGWGKTPKRVEVLEKRVDALEVKSVTQDKRIDELQKGLDLLYRWMYAKEFNDNIVMDEVKNDLRKRMLPGGS